MNNIQEYNYYFRPTDNILFKVGDEVKFINEEQPIGKITKIWHSSDHVVKVNINNLTFILYWPYRKNTIEKIK